MFCEDGNSVNEEGFDYLLSLLFEELEFDEVEDEVDDSEGILNGIISKFSSVGINVFRVIWKVE